MKRAQLAHLVLASVILYFASVALAEDWPTFGKDASRIGATDESLNFPLTRQWLASPPESHTQAWPSPEDRIMEGKALRHRMTFDDAFHVAVVGQRVYFGSSVDHQVRCVDLKSGKEIWTFFTGGPVRLAPTVHKGKVYIGSDDGSAYCLNSVNGKLVWKIRPGPTGEKILGRQQMVSRWPVRTGITIYEDKEEGAIAYFGAGVFPHEYVYLYAVNAEDGRVIWKVDNLSQQSANRIDLSPQGYMLANEELLVIPSGRSLPAVLDRKTGELDYQKRHSWRSSAGGVVGGTQACLADGQVYSWGAHHILALSQKSGGVGFGFFDGHQMAIGGDAAFIANGKEIARLNRLEYAKASSKRHDLDMVIYNTNRKLRSPENKAAEYKKKIADAKVELAKLKDVGFVWRKESQAESRLVVAGKYLLAGGLDHVVAYDIESGKEVWKAKVDGEARGLAVANGHLIVSTDKGDVICFGNGAAKSAARSYIAGAEPFAKDKLTRFYASAAESILKASGIKKGFCLVVGNEKGRLAVELAKRSELEFYCVEADPVKVAKARKTLSEAGLYGSRISIHQGEIAEIPYANYFADLVVSDTLVITGKLPAGTDAQTLARHVKPVGGVVCLGPKNTGELKIWLTGMGMGKRAEIGVKNGYAMLTRGALEGAGSWSHQYGEAGNTACSYDYRVKGGLGVLWYGDPGEGKMVNRHDGAVGPLAINGRLIMQGENRIMVYDAYNGRFLWERENPDSIRTGVFGNQNPGNLVASDDRLFFMQRNECIELDVVTGEEMARHLLPESARGETHEWGYVSYKDGILFGTATIRAELDKKLRRRGRTTDDSTDGIFAIDAKTGKHLWHYNGNTIAHHTVAIGDDSVYFIDSTITSDQRNAILRQDKTEFKNLTVKEQAAAEKKLKTQDIRLAVSLDTKTGKKNWEKSVDVTDCSEIGIGGGKLTLLYRNNILLLCGANANGHYWKQFMGGEFSKRRLVALSGDDGYTLWKKDGNYRHRPIIVNEDIIAEPWSYDLYTGKQKTRKNPLTGEDEPWSMMRSGHHCGMIVGSPNMLTFRSGFTSFYDMEQDIGTKHFAGHRTGCWINAIPGNGLISIPESSAGCVCLFSIASTIVMEPREERKDWAIFSSTGVSLPVKEMAISFGAPGDRRAKDGKAWLTYPRPRPDRVTSLDLSLKYDEKFQSGGGYINLNSEIVDVDETISGAGPDWMYGSWANGLKECSIPLLAKGDAPAAFTVKLHFGSPKAGDGEVPAGERKFDVLIQGKLVAKNVTVANGDAAPVIRSVSGIRVTDNLKIELVPKSEGTGKNELPLLNGIEVSREG
ncbi:PQQ-binding-like beta-propeller repeat protein [Verrucomicrobia bacterium]|nr:PQQ-binding-like beta-propeller repeat protein [Verrucomicrobiota bacterium]